MDKKELLEKAKAAKSAEEIMEIAKAAGQEITADEAKQYFEEFRKTEELSDEELDSVAGGGMRTSDGYLIVTSLYGCGDSTTFLGTCFNCKHRGTHHGASVCMK